jgi:hypothetical protein
MKQARNVDIAPLVAADLMGPLYWMRGDANPEALGSAIGRRWPSITREQWRRALDIASELGEADHFFATAEALPQLPGPLQQRPRTDRALATMTKPCARSRPRPIDAAQLVLLL